MSDVKTDEQLQKEYEEKMIAEMAEYAMHKDAEQYDDDTSNDKTIDDYKADLESAMDILDQCQTDDEGKLIIDPEAFTEDELEALNAMSEYSEFHNQEKYEYVVRGALLHCSCGSHHRRLNLPKCHGVYRFGNPLMRSDDCKAGLEGSNINITSFGICKGPRSGSIGQGNISLAKEVLDENGVPVNENSDSGVITGDRCMASFSSGTWENVHYETQISDEGKFAITTNSFLKCEYGGIIRVVTSGQEIIIQEDDIIPDEYIELKETLSKELRSNGFKNVTNEDIEKFVSMHEEIFPSDKNVMDEFLLPLYDGDAGMLTDIQNIKAISYLSPEPYKDLMFDVLPNVDIFVYDSSNTIFDGGQMAIPVANKLVVDIVSNGSDLQGIDDPRGPYFTLFHEIGHQIDYSMVGKNTKDHIVDEIESLLGKETNNISRLDQRTQLNEIVRSDVYSNINSTIGLFNTSGDETIASNVLSAFTNDGELINGSTEETIFNQVVQQYKKDLISSDWNGNMSSANNTAVTDVYGAFTNNILRLHSYGHDNLYWEVGDVVDIPSMELFADHFAANITGYESHITSQQEYFPDATKAIRQSICSYMGDSYVD